MVREKKILERQECLKRTCRDESSSFATAGHVLMKVHAGRDGDVAERFTLFDVDGLNLLQNEERVELLRSQLPRVIVRIARRQMIVKGQSVGSIERTLERIEHDLRATTEFLARFEILQIDSKSTIACK